MREDLTKEGKLGLRLLEDLTTLAAGGSVFLNMLVKVTWLDLPLWHRIFVLEILRGFCVEACTFRLLFQTFDMNPKNTNVVENMVRALALVVSNIQMVLLPILSLFGSLSIRSEHMVL